MPVTANQPSFAELAAALKALQQPDPGGLNKHVQTIVVAAAMGIGAWLLTGLNTVQNTLGQVSVTMVAVQKTTEDTSRKVDDMVEKQAILKARQDGILIRLDRLEGKPSNSTQP